jgi:hypothetical protein
MNSIPWWKPTRIAFSVWCGLVLGLAIYGYLFPRSHTVYNIYSAASRTWWTGRDIYSVYSEINDTAYYRYSPLFAVAISPFAYLPEPWGNALWRIFNCAVFTAGLWVWARRVLPRQITSAQIAAFCLLVGPIALHSMYNAQANLIMLGAILLGLAGAVDEKWNRAAGWIAVACLIKGYPIALALLMAVLYGRRFAIRFMTALTIGLLLPFLAQWPGVVVAQYASWFGHMRDSTEIMRERLRSIDHLFVLYAQPLSPRVFLLSQLAAGIAVLGSAKVYFLRQADIRQRAVFLFALFSVWAVLFGPATEACAYSIIAPAVAWGIVEAFENGWSFLYKGILIFSLILMGPATNDTFGPIVRKFANDHGSQPIGALIFMSTVLARIRQRIKCTPSTHFVDTDSLATAA